MTKSGFSLKKKKNNLALIWKYLLQTWVEVSTFPEPWGGGGGATKSKTLEDPAFLQWELVSLVLALFVQWVVCLPTFLKVSLSFRKQSPADPGVCETWTFAYSCTHLHQFAIPLPPPSFLKSFIWFLISKPQLKSWGKAGLTGGQVNTKFRHIPSKHHSQHHLTDMTSKLNQKGEPLCKWVISLLFPNASKESSSE